MAVPKVCGNEERTATGGSSAISHGTNSQKHLTPSRHTTHHPACRSPQPDGLAAIDEMIQGRTSESVGSTPLSARCKECKYDDCIGRSSWRVALPFFFFFFLFRFWDWESSVSDPFLSSLGTLSVVSGYPPHMILTVGSVSAGPERRKQEPTTQHMSRRRGQQSCHRCWFLA